MGPRPGSPAAETRAVDFEVFREELLRAAIALLSLLSVLPCAWAASVETSHQVTVVVVPSVLSFSDDSGERDGILTFDDSRSGDGSRSVNYSVWGNSFSTGEMPGLLTAQADTPPGIALKADVGTFTSDSPGGALLYPAVSGEQAIGSDPVSLADKGSASGPQSELVQGKLPVRWETSSQQDISSEDSPITLTVTIKDS